MHKSKEFLIGENYKNRRDVAQKIALQNWKLTQALLYSDPRADRYQDALVGLYSDMHYLCNQATALMDDS